MAEIDKEKIKKKLLEEKNSLEYELEKIARRNPENPDDWEPTPPPASGATADKNEVADRFEDFEERRSTEIQLELRLNNVKKAIKKIENGSYGLCEVDNEPIEPDRLEANPAATTCIKHTE